MQKGKKCTTYFEIFVTSFATSSFNLKNPGVLGAVEFFGARGISKMLKTKPALTWRKETEKQSDSRTCTYIFGY